MKTAAREGARDPAGQAVYDAPYGSGFAESELDRLAGVVAASGLVEADMLNTEEAELRAKIESLAAAGPVPVAGETGGGPDSR